MQDKGGKGQTYLKAQLRVVDFAARFEEFGEPDAKDIGG